MTHFALAWLSLSLHKTIDTARGIDLPDVVVVAQTHAHSHKLRRHVVNNPQLLLNFFVVKRNDTFEVSGLLPARARAAPRGILRCVAPEDHITYGFQW